MESILQQLLIFATAPKACEKSFFGLWPWYHYLPASQFGVNLNGQNYPCEINNFTFFSSSSAGDIPLVALAIVDDLLRIAGLVAVGFVIYGGIQYITSQGNPDGTARAQSTVLNALIGLAVAVVATAFVSFLGNTLGN